jgi:hypothetical protein
MDAVICPITFAPIELPVIIHSTPSYPFECRALIHWLKNYRRVNPVTGERLYWSSSPLEVITPLGTDEQVAYASQMLINELEIGETDLSLRKLI